MSVLLDVNVLVALGWPSHEHHRTARRWFDEHGSEGWATTPVTESGFVRVSSNRAVLPLPTSPATAIELLDQLTRRGTHTFWPDDVQLVVGPDVDRAHRLRGHRQVTDAHLLALTQARGGRLLTLDHAVAQLDPGNLVELLA